MKLFLKKYGLTIGLSILPIIMFIIFRLIQDVKFIHLEICLWTGSLTSMMLIRAVDDFFDYDIDRKANKKTLPKSLVTALFIILSALTLISFTITNKILGLILGIIYISYVIIMMFRNNKIGKMFIGFIFTIIIVLLLSTLYDDNYYLNDIITLIYGIIISVLVLAGSIIFGIIKGKKK